MSQEYAFLISQLGEPESSVRNRADDLYTGVVKPILDEHGLAVRRSDMEATPGVVTNQIVRRIVEARLVIADVTGRNPNVFYELGIAHSFAKPVILLVNRATELPFDAQGERAIEIGDDGVLIGVRHAERAKTALASAVDSVLSTGFVVDNVVTSAAGAQSLSNLAPSEPLAAALAEISASLAELREAFVSRPTHRAIDGPPPAIDLNPFRPMLRALLAACTISMSPDGRRVSFEAPNDHHARRLNQSVEQLWAEITRQVPTVAWIEVIGPNFSNEYPF